MRAKPLHLILFLSIILLGSCESALLQESTIPIPDTPAPIAQTTSEDPAEVLQEFVTAWDKQDFEAMYRLLAKRSRELYPEQSFIDKYTAAHSVIRFSGVQHQLTSEERQGTTAILRYDAVIESPTFGLIVDEDRVMRLIDDGGWKVAWSPMDIIHGMSSKARLTERADFPDRATIYAEDGSPLAQQDALVYSLYAIKQDMPNVDVCLNTLAEVLSSLTKKKLVLFICIRLLRF